MTTATPKDSSTRGPRDPSDASPPSRLRAAAVMTLGVAAIAVGVVGLFVIGHVLGPVAAGLGLATMLLTALIRRTARGLSAITLGFVGLLLGVVAAVHGG